MELLSQVSNVQILYPAAAVAVVLVCAALVFIFGFHSAEQPQFDKLPLVLDDKKSSNKKRKTKEKKSSPNRTADEVKTKTETVKKSPAKEKKEEKPEKQEKQKEPEKPKPKEKAAEPKPVKKEVNDVKKGKKKPLVEAEKPADFDDGVWEEVPKKSDKKKVKAPEEKDKKDSPTKKKKKAKDADVEAARPAEESAEEPTKVTVTVETPLDEESSRALQAQVEEFQRVLKEAERRDQAALGNVEEDDVEDEEVPEVKDLRSNKKKENKEKQIKKKAVESAAVKSGPKGDEKDASDSSEKQDDNQNVPVFDELGDTWTDAKVAKKGKKKARKE